ncbi:MAG: Holliday junction resolvase RuvX [Clostridia bacterium]|nr:Holliday junction resolvase RuvX [Lachnospiraceae bacterium]NCC01595.1 Holliday junction resolvase RuvX [Clostridia bacterium]NCD02330.1 Holliday junction resolvase RuvX [Clostridia bacterium]
MRIIGLDYGSKTVGVAVSDELGWTAQALETISRKEENKLRKTLARIEELVRTYGAESIVLGYPKHMNNEAGDRCAKTEEFKAMLERRIGIPVILQDERMSTVSAERILMEGGVRRENRKEYVDKMAAAFILQTYLERMSHDQEDRSI